MGAVAFPTAEFPSLPLVGTDPSIGESPTEATSSSRATEHAPTMHATRGSHFLTWRTLEPKADV